MNFDPQTLERYRLKLRYKVSHHLGGFCPDIEDVVQETLTRFLSALRDDKIRNPESTGAFLSGICNNVVLEYRRRLWKEPSGDDEPARRDPADASPADLLEMRDAIGAALAELSERDQEILRAFFLQEKSKDEICRAMDLSDGQFRVALFRAKDRFRKIYRRGMKHAGHGGH